MISTPFQAARSAAAVDNDIATRRSDFVEPIHLDRVARLEPEPEPRAEPEPPSAPGRSWPQVIDGSNRRVAPRTGISVEVTLKSEHNFYAGFSENISEGGLFVATDALQPVGTLIQIAFTLPKLKETFDLLAEVRWVRPASVIDPEIPAGMGLKFINLDWDAEDSIADFVRARQPIFYVD